jgi:hypothetical protein
VVLPSFRTIKKKALALGEAGVEVILHIRLLQIIYLSKYTSCTDLWSQ